MAGELCSNCGYVSSNQKESVCPVCLTNLENPCDDCGRPMTQCKCNNEPEAICNACGEAESLCSC